MLKNNCRRSARDRSIGVHAKPALPMRSHGKSWQILPRKFGGIGCSSTDCLPEKDLNREWTWWALNFNPKSSMVTADAGKSSRICVILLNLWNYL